MGKNMVRPEDENFGKDLGLVHEAIVTGKKVGAGRDFWSCLAHNEEMFGKIVKFFNNERPSVTQVGTEKSLNFSQFISWFRKNNLEKYLAGKSLEKQIVEQEKFNQQFYGKKFRFDRKKVFVDVSRLPAIKAGLEAGCLNCILIKATPAVLSETEAQMTEAEFFFERLMKQLKEKGFKIWAETGTDRWTNLTLAELLKRSNPAEPEEFNSEAFKNDWVAEEMRILNQKGPVPKIQAGIVEIIFTNNYIDVPSDRVIVNKIGEIVVPDDRSYISAVAKNVRVLSMAEGIILSSQIFIKEKKYLAPSTWEWKRDLVRHDDNGASPICSVARADFCGGEFSLYSDDADNSAIYGRLRLAL